MGRINRELRLLESELESLKGHIDANRFLGVNSDDWLVVLNRLAAAKGWTVTKWDISGSNRFEVKKTGSKATRKFCIIIHDNKAQYEYEHETGVERDTYSDLSIFNSAIESTMDMFENHYLNH